MKAQFRILSGSRAGQTDVFSKSEIVAGRHPSCDLQFHPEQDLDVSSRHALIVKTGQAWTVRDLQSRNGTLVNGHRINADTRLDDTDQIQLGPGGPKVEFRIVSDGVADTAPPAFTLAADAAARVTSGAAVPTPASGKPPDTGGRAPAKAAPRSGGSTTQRIRVEVARQTRRFKRVSLTLAAILVIAVGAFFMVTQRQEQGREREIAAMRARTDSIVAAADEAVRTLQGQMAGLATALRQSQTEVQGLQTRLASAQVSGDRTQMAQLRRQLDDASEALRFQQAAALVDYNAIYQANQKAVGLVYVRFQNGEIFTGTAFAVRPDGVMITNRHVVRGKDGSQRPRDVAVQFADSKQVFKADVLATSNEVDLAAIKVNLAGLVPSVKGLTQTEGRPGDPVAVIGFPLGLDLPMLVAGEGRPVVKTTFTAGIVSKILPDQVQIDGYGAEGASGSPIFDRNGEVAAVLFGGEPGTNGRVVYGVPASYVVRLLQGLD